MENTIENKKRFVAQYFGCNVLSWESNIKKDINIIDGAFLDDFDSNNGHDYFVTLKPLSLITDDDLSEIHDNEAYNGEIPELACANLIGGYFVSDISITDFLRSKGYALPWMGLSVEQQVEYGWVKLHRNHPRRT